MSEPANTTTTSAPATTPAPPATWPRRLWLNGRVLVTVGAVGFAIFVWTWSVKVDGHDASTQYVLLVTPGDIVGVFNPFIFHAMTILGVLIVPFLWLSRRFLGLLIAMSATILWILVLTTLYANQIPINSVRLIDGLTPSVIPGQVTVQTQIGFWLTFATLLLLYIGGLAIVFGLGWTSIRSQQSTLERPAPARLVRLPAAGGLTLGLILFLIGILGMGWTAVNCTDRPLFLGQCTGLTFPGVLHYGIATQTDAFDPIAARFTIPVLLVGGAVLILIGLWWWRRLTPGLSLWLTIYLAIATFFFVVAYAGTGTIALHSGALGLQAGTWTAQSGLWVTALGLLFGWIALIPLWFRALRPAETTTERPT